MPRELTRALWRRGRLWLLLEPRDLWIGVYVAPKAVYVGLVPCLVLKFERKPRWWLMKRP